MFYMQLSYVRFNIIHCWKNSLRPSKLQSHFTGNVPLLVSQRGLFMIWLKFSNRSVGCPRSCGRRVSFSECSTKQVHTSLTQSCYPNSTICLMWHVGFRRPERKLFQGHIKTISLFAKQNRKLTIDIRLFGRLITLSHRELRGKH